MGDLLEALKKLQIVESKLAVIRRAEEAKRSIVEIKQRNLRRAEDKATEKHSEIRTLQMRIDAASLDVASKEETIAKHREGLNKAKTNKEYAAILAAMNTETVDSSRQEGDALKLMDDLAALQAAKAQFHEQQQKASDEVVKAESVVAAFLAQSEDELAKLLASRASISTQILPGALAVFSRIAERHDGEALAPIVLLNPKREDYACSGCNMKLTLDLVNSVRVRDDIQICQTCGRILCSESNPSTAIR